MRLNNTVKGEGLSCLVIGSSIYYPKTFSKELENHLKMFFADIIWFATEYKSENLDRVDINSIVDDIEQNQTS